MTRTSTTLISIALLFLAVACSGVSGSSDSNPTRVDAGSGTGVSNPDAAHLDGSGTPVDEIDYEDLTYPIVDTGQATCYGTSTAMTCGGRESAFGGQDAQYQGIGFDLVDNGDGTITDRVTGLMWQKDPGDKMTFDEAVAAADSFILAGHDDWRLPNAKELQSIVDCTRSPATTSSAAIDPVFAATPITKDTTETTSDLPPFEPTYPVVDTGQDHCFGTARAMACENASAVELHIRRVDRDQYSRGWRGETMRSAVVSQSSPPSTARSTNSTIVSPGSAETVGGERTSKSKLSTRSGRNQRCHRIMRGADSIRLQQESA